jgi:hypothetical protein
MELIDGAIGIDIARLMSGSAGGKLKGSSPGHCWWLERYDVGNGRRPPLIERFGEAVRLGVRFLPGMLLVLIPSIPPPATSATAQLARDTETEGSGDGGTE